MVNALHGARILASVSLPPKIGRYTVYRIFMKFDVGVLDKKVVTQA
jgi:hypothetical protein